MACDLKEVKAGLLQPPTLSLPSISRPDLSNIVAPEKSDQTEHQECFAWLTPLGNEVKKALPIEGLQGGISDIFKFGIETLGQIAAALMPLEMITKFIEPIEAGLAALSGETDPSAIVTALVDIATELATLLTTVTSTYPLLLLAKILEMLDCLCEAISEVKEFLTAVTEVMDKIVEAVGTIASDITSEISEEISKVTTEVTEAISSLSERQTSFDDDVNAVLDKNAKNKDRFNAFVGLVVGGAPKLASEGLSTFSDQVIEEPVLEGSKKVKNFLIGDPEVKDDKGVRGRVQTYFENHGDDFDFLYSKSDEKANLKLEAQKFKFEQAEIRFNAELPKLEDCFEAALSELSELASSYLSGAQDLIENVVQGAVENLTNVLSGLTFPLLDALPECP